MLNRVARLITRILQVAYSPLPSVAFALIVHVPSFLAVTLPRLFTVATFLLLLVHFTILFVAPLDETVAFNCIFFPTVSL